MPRPVFVRLNPAWRVKTSTDQVRAARHTLVELLMSDHPTPCARQQQSGDCELEHLASVAGIKEPRFPHRTNPRGKDDSSAVIAVDHEACILCDRCVRGCDDIRHNWVLARRGKGYQAGIAFDNNLPMSESSCVSCGECMVSCPTGALTNKRVVGTQLGQGDVLDPAELLDLPIFQNVSGTFLELNQKAVVKRHFKAGEKRSAAKASSAQRLFTFLKARRKFFFPARLHTSRRKVAARASSANCRVCWRRARETGAAKNPTGRLFPSTPRWTCRTTIPSPN